MLLAIDIGNTNTVFAVYDNDTLKGTWRLSTRAERTADEYAGILEPLFARAQVAFGDIKGVILASVVPQAVFGLRMFAREYCGNDALIVGKGSVDLGIEVNVERKRDVGADRVVNAIAGFKRYGGNLIIVDFGTATTFDVVGEQGSYEGGVIAPGINLSMKALHAAAAKLPEIAITKPKSVIGKSTESAMQSGVFWGYVSLLEGVINRIQKEYGRDMKVVATGGLASLFVKAVDVIEEEAGDLTIEGLKLLYDANTA